MHVFAAAHLHNGMSEVSSMYQPSRLSTTVFGLFSEVILCLSNTFKQHLSAV